MRDEEILLQKEKTKEKKIKNKSDHTDYEQYFC